MEIVLNHLHRAAARNHQSYSIVLIRLDDISKYRALHGDAEADRLLQDVTQRFSSRIRRSDQLYRYTDNELLALLPDAPLRGALLVADRSRSEIEELLESAGLEEPDLPTLRYGFATYDGNEHETPQEWSNIVKRAEFSLSIPVALGEPTPPH
jgi:diguanylate cyclase (GGDEF)-like protein